jgi:hypothetical protein
VIASNRRRHNGEVGRLVWGGNQNHPSVLGVSVEFNLQFDPTNKILLVTFGTVVTKASGMAAYVAVRAFVLEHSPGSAIVDLSAVENAELSTDAVKYFAALPTVFPAGSLIILVANQAELFGMCRMYQILREERQPNLHVVHWLEEAYALLNLKSPNFRSVDTGPTAAQSVP